MPTTKGVLAYQYWQCVLLGGVQQDVYPTMFIMPIACLRHFTSGVDGVGSIMLATDPVALFGPASKDLGPLACPCLPSQVCYKLYLRVANVWQLVLLRAAVRIQGWLHKSATDGPPKAEQCRAIYARFAQH